MPNDSMLDAARKTLANAQNFTGSVNKQAGVTPPQGAGHAIGQSFAAAHGADHQGYTPSQGAKEVGDVAGTLAWKAQQVQAVTQ